MAMALSDLRRRDELLNRLKVVWNDLSAEERSAVEVVVDSIILNHAQSSVDEPAFTPLSENELFERIDLSLAQADRGEYMDADLFEKDIALEFNLK